MNARTRRADPDFQALLAATADERTRFNAALANGATATLPTAFGPYTVDGVDADWWYHCHPASANQNWANARSFAGCNDGAWADLLAQAGVARNPRFAR